MYVCVLTQFKSQTIDTPGVIERVSTLFRGQPSLIQGFNTFLPPGYRIECSVDQNDANMITVTTPSGTTTQTLGGHGIAGAISRMSKGGEAPPPPHDAGPPGRYAPPPGVYNAPPPGAEYDPRARPPSGGPPERPPHALHGRAPSPGPMGLGGYSPSMPFDSARGMPVDASRPPVEFNHAINYVNKIKQRFAGDPDTYKQFLEILQTYQKEQRPIHEVYAQVTILFDHAQDLLDEFKRFLPDTNANPGAGGSGGLFGMLGHVTNGMGPPSEVPGVPAYETLPPRAPAGVGKKKRSVSGVDEPPPAPVDAALGKSARTKRSKHGKPEGGMRPDAYMPLPPGEMHEMYAPPPGYDRPPEAPGYMPGVYDMPAYPPGMGNVMQMPHMASADEVAFFERVKKHIDDRATYLDFLKLLNLYTQDVIGVATLVDRVTLFLGGQPELVAAFKALCGYDMSKHGWLETEEPMLENVPALERERVDLSSQRTYGPSYRRLPDSEVNLACSGRDPLCWEVLNDVWVSHPTWASEGESFNPHKKNVHEDALYRSEEERHEYDYHIEANLRTIALLEPIAARIATMDAEERAGFRLKPGLGGQSKSIYQRILKKVYGRNHGLEVIAALHENPSVAVPVVLARLKQKDEEWKRAQREWNKVWREVDARNYYKALDHQGVNFKSLDKKTITTKAFVNEIETLRAAQQQRRLALDPSLPALAPRFQLTYELHDGSVLADVLRMAGHFIDRPTSGFSAGDRERIEHVFRTLLTPLLGVRPEALAALMVRKRDDDDESAAEDEDETDTEMPRRPRKGADLRRHALRNHAEAGHDHAAPPSTWHMTTSADVLPHGDAALPRAVELFGNTTLYVFLRLLQLLYTRLQALKAAAAHMAATTPNAWTKVNPLAAELGLMDTASGPAGVVSAVAKSLAPRADLGADPLPPSERAVLQLDPAQYYDILMELIARLFDHEIDPASYEEAVRFMYGTQAYPAMTLDKVVHALVKSALTISSDAKCQELLTLFTTSQDALQEIRHGRAAESAESRDVQLYKRLIATRMDAENVVGRDEHLFRVEMVPLGPEGEVPPHTMHVQLLSHDDMTLEDPRDAEQRWLQYIASYCLYAPTEGLPSESWAPFLQRNLPATPQPALDGVRFVVRNGLDIRVCMRTYRLFFVQGTEDVFARTRPAPEDPAVARTHATARSKRWHAWLAARREVIDAPDDAGTADAGTHAEPAPSPADAAKNDGGLRAPSPS